MPTIIDALVVELGFDTAGIEPGRRKVEAAFKQTRDSAERTGKDIEKSSKSAEQYLTRLRNNVLALYAAFTGGRGLKEFITDVTQSNAALGRFAQMIGQSATDIATWRGAGRLMGIDAKEIDSTFENLTAQFQQFSLTGDSTIVPWFRALGLSIQDASGAMKPVNQLLLELSQRVQGMESAKAKQFLSNMGISPGMISVILQGPPAIQRLLDKQKELAKAQAADIEAAQKRQAAWAAFMSQAERVGTILLTTLTPAILAVSAGLEAVANWAGDNPNAAGAVFAALTGIVLALSGALLVNLAGTAIAAAVAGFTAMTGLAAGLILKMAVLTASSIPALSEAFFAMALAIEATPIGWIVTGLGLISAAGFLIYKNWNKIAAWWHSLWGGMGQDAAAGADKIAGAAERASGGAAGGRAPGYGAKGGPTQEGDIQTLMGFGWTRPQAAGMVASLQAESAGKLDASGDGGRAFGLAQWHQDRQDRFRAWAGHDIQSATRAEQLGFINFELRNHEAAAGRALAGSQDADSAARNFSALYERPADAIGQGDTRAAIARALAQASPTAVPPPARVGAAAGGNRYQTNNTSSDVRIGSMTINSKATDAKGIAADIKPALQDSFAQQANFGPT